ncbi:hypothetical protein C8R43DRAFT_952485 [Mycena crocata]|nr:hypothetical protein C8R43DRAFT_952485 [Mycena crocata]
MFNFYGSINNSSAHNETMNKHHTKSWPWWPVSHRLQPRTWQEANGGSIPPWTICVENNPFTFSPQFLSDCNVTLKDLPSSLCVNSERLVSISISSQQRLQLEREPSLNVDMWPVLVEIPKLKWSQPGVQEAMASLRCEAMRRVNVRLIPFPSTTSTRHTLQRLRDVLPEGEYETFHYSGSEQRHIQSPGIGGPLPSIQLRAEIKRRAERKEYGTHIPAHNDVYIFMLNFHDVTSRSNVVQTQNLALNWSSKLREKFCPRPHVSFFTGFPTSRCRHLKTGKTRIIIGWGRQGAFRLLPPTNFKTSTPTKWAVSRPC